MCWEIIVSLRAIWLFHVYIMHMHGLQQSSETRYPISHPVLHLSRFRERYISERGFLCWKVKVGIWNKHVVSIWALRRSSRNPEQSISFPAACEDHRKSSIPGQDALWDAWVIQTTVQLPLKDEHVLYHWRENVSSYPAEPRVLTSASIIRIRADPQRRSDSNHSA